LEASNPSALYKPVSYLLVATSAKMAFQSKNHKQSRAAMLYRSAVAKHPFILFGLPFLAVIVSGSFFLTPATALRYEKHDQKRKWMSKEEALSSMEGLQRRKVNPRDEYYVSMGVAVADGTQLTICRDWRLRISTIGSREESSDCQENRMAYWNESAMLNTCMDWRLGISDKQIIYNYLRGGHLIAKQFQIMQPSPTSKGSISVFSSRVFFCFGSGAFSFS
jgi:cytochrome c oxidase assembly protein subunit 16